ncbi:MAG: septal ring lytic transglycosylase RlpA family protein [Gammaproteobacteria bacterium]
MHLAKLVISSCITLLLTHCGTSTHLDKDGPPIQYFDASTIKEPIPKKEPLSHYGNPSSYVVNGQRYDVLKSSQNYHQEGFASWYGRKFNGHLTSTREIYDMLAMTAASPILPLPTYVKVTNLDNHRHVIVRVNDRGPFHPGRILDLSYAAATKLGMLKKGTAHVQVDAIPLDNQPNDNPQPYYVQAAAFNECHHAQLLAKRLETLSSNAVRIVNVHQPQNTVSCRVQVGPLSTLAQSQQVQNSLEKAGILNTFVVTG